MQSVPIKPFMIVLGTSHTNGDCEEGDVHLHTLESGKRVNLVQKTAYERVAEELGLEIVQFGLSGCGNIDLLEATNELLTRGFFNDNCKLFVLEPRSIDSTVKLPEEFFDTSLSPTWFLDNGESISTLQSWGPRRVDDINSPRAPVIQQIGKEVNVNIEYPNSYYKERYPNAEINLIKKAREVHIFSATSTLQVYQNFIYIDAIKNIATSNGINFKWQTWNLPEVLIKTVKHMLPDSNLFDYFVGEICPQNGHAKANKLFCSCGHYNEKGHIYWYDNIIRYMKIGIK